MDTKTLQQLVNDTINEISLLASPTFNEGVKTGAKRLAIKVDRNLQPEQEDPLEDPAEGRGAVSWGILSVFIVVVAVMSWCGGKYL